MDLQVGLRKKDPAAGARMVPAENFLGFTHICGSIHKTGRFTVMRKTIGKRMAAKLKGIAQAHARAHSGYRRMAAGSRAGLLYLPRCAGELFAVAVVRHDVARSWWQAVRRRGQHVLRREVFDRIVAQYLPTPVILHPYPLERFSVKHPRQEPCALTLTSARTGPCGGCRATGIPTAISGELSVRRIKNAETDGY